MGAACPSQPPPAPRAKPLSREDVDRDRDDRANPTECKSVRAGDARAVDLLNEVLTKRGTSNTELGEVVGCGEQVLRAVRSRNRRRPFKVGHLFAIDRRTALAIWNAIHVALLTDPVPSSNSHEG